MRVEFHSLYWPGTSPEIVESQKKVMKHFDIPINYTIYPFDHGEWMTWTIENSKSDIVCFFDIDCVPINKLGVFARLEWLKQSKTFFGIAQVSNHIPPATHIYAAPAFFAIHKECWNKLKVSMKAGSDGIHAGDVGELFTYAAEKQNIEFSLIYPTHVYIPKWKLANRGCYGIGTIFSGIYHLYESRYADNIELFKKHCDDIIRGSLNFNEFIEVKI